jgi:flagellar protein FlaG
MSFEQPQITLTENNDYRDTYANSVQIRMSVWDFHLAFGTLQSQVENRIEVKNFQGIYLSPQQAKALTLMLQQNLANYEQAFGEIKLDPNMAKGPIH